MCIRDSYDFLWSVLCDWYIELVKPRLFIKEGRDYENACRVLAHVLRGAMELLHPFMPFITETIWQSLPHDGESIVIAPYPKYREELRFDKEEASMELLISAIRQIRNRRAEMNVPPSKRRSCMLYPKIMRRSRPRSPLSLKSSPAPRP